MRKFLALIAIIVLSAPSITFAQSDTIVKANIKCTLTKESLSVDLEVPVYNPIYMTLGGSRFMAITSPGTDKEYAVWIGKETTETYQNQEVRISKSGKYFVLKANKNKDPYCKYITEAQFDEFQ